MYLSGYCHSLLNRFKVKKSEICRIWCNTGENKHKNVTMKYVTQVKGAYTYGIGLHFCGLIVSVSRYTREVPRCDRQQLLVSEWWITEYSKYNIYVLILGVGMQAGIPRNQLSSLIRTDGCTIKVDTKKGWNATFRIYSFARSSKTKGRVRLSNAKVCYPRWCGRQQLLVSEWWRTEYGTGSGNASRYPTKSIIVDETKRF